MKIALLFFAVFFQSFAFSMKCDSDRNQAVYKMTCDINAPHALGILKSCGKGVYDAIITDNVDSAKSIFSKIKSFFTDLTLKDLCYMSPVVAVPMFAYDSYNFMTREDVLPIIQEVIHLILSRNISGLRNLLYQVFEPILEKIEGAYKHLRSELHEAFEGFISLFEDPLFFNHAAELACNFLSASGIGTILSIFTGGAAAGLLAFNVMKSAYNIKKVTGRLSKLKTRSQKIQGLKCAF